MFPRQQRLRRKRDIAALLKRGRFFRTPHLTLRIRPTTLSGPRVTVVASTVVSKRATVRNRVKRQLRHLLAAELAGVAHGVDIMASVRIPFLSASRTERVAVLRDLLRRARLSR